MIERCLFVVCLDKKVTSPEDVFINGDATENNTNHNHNYTNGNGIKDYIKSEEYEVSDEMSRTAFQMLHGCNSRNNSGNRWFDKTMQFIISEDGYCGLNYEHSPAEGIVVIELSEHLFRYM
jgi:hypothetical protein